MTRRSAEIEQTEVSRLLSQGGYVSAYRALVEQAERDVVRVPKTTVAQRKEMLRQVIEEIDLERLQELQDKMVTAIDTIIANELDLSGDHILTREEAHSLLEEMLDQRDIKELLTVRYAMAKEAVFQSLTTELAEKGVEDPENHNGEIVVPELGHRFVREACGRKDPRLDEEKLRNLLGEELWKQACEAEVVRRQVIPRHIEYHLSIERLMKLAADDPDILDKINESLEVGGWKTPRFAIKPLKER